MQSITRYNPVRDLAGADPMETLFRGFFMPSVWPDMRALGQHTQFKVDVTENDKEFHVLAEMPGVNKNDISVTIERDSIAISAEVKKEKDVRDENGSVLRSERQYGKLYRAFQLGDEVDEATAKASYHDGVLELTLPKAAGNGKRKKRLVIH